MVSVNTRRGSGLFCCPERSHVSCVMREIGNQLIAVIRITADRQMTQARGRLAPWQLQVHADDATACRKCHSRWVCLLANFQNMYDRNGATRDHYVSTEPCPNNTCSMIFENLIYLCMHKLVHALRGRNSWPISSVQNNVKPCVVEGVPKNLVPSPWCICRENTPSPLSIMVEHYTTNMLSLFGIL